MRFTNDQSEQRLVKYDWFHWNYCFVTSLGIYCWYARKENGHSINVTHCIRYNHHFKLHSIILAAGCAKIFKRLFVSSTTTFMKVPSERPQFCKISISGPSATTYAYLGEFHCFKHRSKVMMLGTYSALEHTLFFNNKLPI